MFDLLIRGLRYPLWHTEDYDRAEREPFQWDWEDGKGTLSLLGLVNGILPMLGMVLVAIVDEDTGRGLTLRLKRPWW